MPTLDGLQGNYFGALFFKSHAAQTQALPHTERVGGGREKGVRHRFVSRRFYVSTPHTIEFYFY